LALDEPKNTDDTFQVGDFTFLVDKELMAQAKPISIDLTYMGFQINSSLELGGGCGSSCASGSCGQ